MLAKNIKKIIAYLLCFVLAWTGVVPAYASTQALGNEVDEAAILAQYPNARVIHVDLDSYPQLAEQLGRQGYTPTATTNWVQLASNETIQNNGSTTIEKPESLSNDCNSGSDAKPTADESLRVMVDFSSDMMKSGGNNGDAAAIVFVVIGTVLIVVWALYVFKYIYDIATGFTPCGKWSDLMVTSSSITGDSHQRANFNGVRYMTGFRDGATEVGISVELGYSDIFLDEINTELNGRYWFIGPVLRWRLSTSRNPNHFQMNFLAGSTEIDELGVIAQATLELQFGIGDAMRLGISWGAININIERDQGFITEREQYYYLYGLSMGYQF